MDPLAPLTGILQRHGVRCSPAEFHAAVNVTFHHHESEIYDEAHRDMWDSLPKQFVLLAEDCLGAGFRPAERLSMLDIGCGTGLASDSMLKSPLGGSLREITLLDTSSAMLKRAVSRSAAWGVPVTVHEGTLDTLPIRPFDVIVTCSVLHHVPDIGSFLANVAALQAPGGVFLHLQDPNGDALGSPLLKERQRSVSKGRVPKWLSRFSPSRFFGRLHRELTGEQGQDYVSKTNRDLLRMGILTSPLSVAELFAITDIHVQDGEGISTARMKQWMPSYELVSERWYGYFGQLESTLPPRLQAEEQVLCARRDPNGMHCAGAWKRVQS